MMKNNLPPNLAPTVVFFSYLTTIHVLLNGMMLKVLTKMQSFSLQF
jgi:hypothetical protein